ncbi:hypothetical protein CRP01_29435 [Flavilitoribacter nigricans DSM 23189 = NBRC 102662]|uniref:M23ase beta-sheet core domain-containing protein n=1 Tax=Flavilitoribacter nigricans (strain ATCC 23147 / DSM 23189 / NBRC 102662 / NCIMB 1420 / SS-2) TaxID=1122177 RepID=A0A2D0N337_FLAN2|nr:hypothetical protein CRP01_29435 [Flavilitoribacter nigricans DSM 23189 = NBRC 102662]
MWVKNPLAGPLVFTVRTDNDTLKAALADQLPVVLGPYETFKLVLPPELESPAIRSELEPYSFWSRMQPAVPDTSVRYVLPFPRGKTHRVIQAYGGKFSHRASPFAYYAIDFDLAVGDTICAARDGVVVGLVEENRNWVHGPDPKYREYANYLRLYHADEIYTDYVHLKYKGALVEMGDTVRAGQAIGISGYTGFTSVPHLHFNVMRPTDQGTLEGIPVRFEQIDGKDLQEGDRVGHD